MVPKHLTPKQSAGRRKGWGRKGGRNKKGKEENSILSLGGSETAETHWH